MKEQRGAFWLLSAWILCEAVVYMGIMCSLAFRDPMKLYQLTVAQIA